MTIKPFQTLAEFLRDNPPQNHSSRVWLRPPRFDGLSLSVADAFIREVGLSISLSAAVADAIIRDVASEAPLIGIGVSSLSFTATTLGNTSDRTLVITNNGGADLLISSLTATGDFTITSITT